jgi:hypothetical protein
METKKRCTSSTAKRQQQQDLCGKAIKVTGNEARNMAVNVTGIKKFSDRERSPFPKWQRVAKQ